jgi:hypothetical protein
MTPNAPNNTMTDLQVDSFDLSSLRFIADVERVARIICERHIAAGSELSWHLLREIEEETLWDLGLLSRWPTETIAEFALKCQIGPHSGLVTADGSVALTGLSRSICNQFEWAREKRAADEPAEGVWRS